MKIEFREKCEENTCTFNIWGMLVQIILVNLTLYVTENCQKITVSFPGETPFKLKINNPKNKTFSIPYLLQAQPALALLLLPVILVQQCADGLTLR